MKTCNISKNDQVRTTENSLLYKSKEKTGKNGQTQLFQNSEN